MFRYHLGYWGKSLLLFLFCLYFLTSLHFVGPWHGPISFPSTSPSTPCLLFVCSALSECSFLSPLHSGCQHEFPTAVNHILSHELHCDSPSFWLSQHVFAISVPGVAIKPYSQKMLCQTPRLTSIITILWAILKSFICSSHFPQHQLCAHFSWLFV